MATSKGSKTALMLALSELSEQGIKPGEFTIADFIAEAKGEGRQISRTRANEVLCGLSRAGKLTCRKTNIGGRIINAYSKP